MWKFSSAYSSETVDEAAMTEIVNALNAKSARYEYRFRPGRGTTDWIVEYRRKGKR